MPLFFLSVLLDYQPFAFPSAFCRLLLLVWPTSNSIGPLLMTYPGPLQLSPADTYLVHLTLSLLTKFSAQSPSVAPPFSPLPLVHPQLHEPARSCTATNHV